MYKHILLPTDGSELSVKAIESGVELAKAIGARVTGLHVMPKAPARSLEQLLGADAGTRGRLKALFAERGRQYLEVVESAAKKAGVRCATVCVAGATPYEEILNTAMAKHCDLIYMASHGKRGSSGLLLGSETAKVLTHSPVAVLVHRDESPMPVASRARPVLARR